MKNANYRSDTFDQILHTVLLEIMTGCFETIELGTLKMQINHVNKSWKLEKRS